MAKDLKIHPREAMLAKDMILDMQNTLYVLRIRLPDVWAQDAINAIVLQLQAMHDKIKILEDANLAKEIIDKDAYALLTTEDTWMIRKGLMKAPVAVKEVPKEEPIDVIK